MTAQEMIKLPEAKAALRFFAEQHNGRTTELTKLQRTLERGGFSLKRREVLDLLRAFQKMGYGELILGRRGKPTRFMWTVPRHILDKGGAMLPVITRKGATTVEHRFWLRQDYEVALMLPSNMTAQEANRLANFIRTLAF